MDEIDPPHPLAARYDALWAESAPAVRAGRITRDSLAHDKDRDARRGVTLLVRPSADVANRIDALLARLRMLEPEQYFQPRADLHQTVLSLFSATPDFCPYLAHLPAYRAAVEEATAAIPPFEIDIRGVTLSTGAVLAQGFPREDALDRLRDRLRAAMTSRGLGGTLDRRYRLTTAHMTLVRFAAPLRDPARFVDAVAAERDTPLGTTRVFRLELVLGDWYQSADREQAIAAYDLDPQPRT